MTARITGAQIRAARAFLKWSIADLAAAADVGSSTVQAVERADGNEARINGGPDRTFEYRAAARDKALDKIAAALVKAGIKFLDDDRKAGQGVRWRGDS